MSHKPSLASALGSGYAYLQHGIDKTIAWGFSTMRKATKDSPVTEKADERKKGILHRVARASRKTLFFFGEAGEAYFHKYEDLKQKERETKGK